MSAGGATVAMFGVVLLAGCAGILPSGQPPGAPPAASGDEARLADMLARCQQARQEEHRKLEQATHQLREERRRNDAMQQKIDALREIDREMMLQRKVP